MFMNTTIPNETQKPRIARTVTKAVFVCIVLFLIANVAWFLYLKSRIARIDRAFSAVNVGDSSSRVKELMGSPDFVDTGDEMAFISLLPEEERDQCTEQYIYSCKTFFLPTFWLFFLDENKKVVLKWRLD